MRVDNHIYDVVAVNKLHQAYTYARLEQNLELSLSGSGVALMLTPQRHQFTTNIFLLFE